jgi:hypothetical protein
MYVHLHRVFPFQVVAGVEWKGWEAHGWMKRLLCTVSRPRWCWRRKSGKSRSCC